MRQSLKTPAILAFLAASLAGLSACKTASPPAPGLIPTDGSLHSEPVMFNGERYQVTFRYLGRLNGYHVAVKRRGRRLRASDKDRADALQVATSALTHYACPQGQKARPADGTLSYAERTWRLAARCA